MLTNLKILSSSPQGAATVLVQPWAPARQQQCLTQILRCWQLSPKLPASTVYHGCAVGSSVSPSGPCSFALTSTAISDGCGVSGRACTMSQRRPALGQSGEAPELLAQQHVGTCRLLSPPVRCQSREGSYVHQLAADVHGRYLQAAESSGQMLKLYGLGVCVDWLSIAHGKGTLACWGSGLLRA